MFEPSAPDVVTSSEHQPLPLQEHILKPCDGYLSLDSLLSTVNLLSRTRKSKNDANKVSGTTSYLPGLEDSLRKILMKNQTGEHAQMLT
jgi:hypothetical protein